jgi:hypothetical protein
LALWAVVGPFVFAAPAGIWTDFYRGMDYLATPSGGPLTRTFDGLRFNGARQGRLRYVPNAAGQGWDLEFDRQFGTDSRGRPEVLDLGAFEVELSGATQATLGYTKRGMFIGTADWSINNLNYSIRGKTGAQNFELSGLLVGTGTMEVNQFGFYTMDLNVSNQNSELTLDGLLVDDTESGDFDIGPISVEGNLFFDGAMALLQSMGVDTSSLTSAFPGSPIDRINAAIDQQIRNTELVAGVTYSNRDALVNSDLATAVSSAQSALLGEVLGLNSAMVSSSVLGTTSYATRVNTNNNGGVVPEPASLLLLAGSILLLLRRRAA